MVLAGNLNRPGVNIFDWVVGAAMAMMHFFCLGTERAGEQLMAEANAENRFFGLQKLLNHGHCIFTGRSRVPGTV